MFQRTCVVCNATFTHPAVRGAVPISCSKACAKARIRARKRALFAQRYRPLRDAGAGRDLAAWGARGAGTFEAAMNVLVNE